jgi:SAM-dependent methyltransferase
MKQLLKNILLNPISAKILIKPILKLHSFTYTFAGKLAIVLNNGVHPKHQIMQYKEWFVENIKEEWVILDVGCNTGMMPEVMSQKAKYVYGLEINCKHIKEAQAKRQRDNIEFICADATSFDYNPLEAIDCLTLSNVLEHIEERVAFLNKLSSQVKWRDEKRFLIRVPMIDREWITIYKKQIGLDYRLDPTHFTEYTFKQFKEELEEAHLNIEKFEIKFGELYAVCKAYE